MRKFLRLFNPRHFFTVVIVHFDCAHCGRRNEEKRFRADDFKHPQLHINVHPHGWWCDECIERDRRQYLRALNTH